MDRGDRGQDSRVHRKAGIGNDRRPVTRRTRRLSATVQVPASSLGKPTKCRTDNIGQLRRSKRIARSGGLALRTNADIFFAKYCE